MEVILRNFRCYKNQSFKFVPGVSLLPGVSGAGKSTILEAIDYALYGKLKQQYSHGETTCSVRIVMGDGQIWIQRNSGPGKFQLCVNGTTYSGDDAQSIINQMYGTREVFLAASYLKQGERCVLMTGTNADKMKLVRSISFQDENVETVQDKIKSDLKVQQEKMRQAENAHNLAKALLSAFDKDNPEVSKVRIEDVQIDADQVQKEITEIGKMIVELEKSMTELISLESKIKTLAGLIHNGGLNSEQNGGLNSEQNGGHLVPQLLLSTIESRTAEIQTRLKILGEQRATFDASQKFRKLFESAQQEVDSLKAEMIELSAKTGQASSTIKAEIMRIKKNLAMQARIDALLKQNGQNNVPDLRTAAGQVAADLRSLKVLISSLEKDLEGKEWNETQLRTLVCPKCSSGLKLDGGNLIVLMSDFKPILRELTCPEVSSSMISAKKREVEMLETKKNVIQAAHSEVNTLLRDLNFHDPNDAIKLITCEKFLQCEEKLIASQSRLQSFQGEVTGGIAVDSTEEASLRSELDLLYKQRAELERGQKVRTDLEQARTLLGDRSSEQISTKLIQLQEGRKAKTILVQLCNKFVKRRDLLEEESRQAELLTGLGHEAKILNELLEIAKQVEIQALEISVAHLNATTARFLNIMFPEDPIQVEFKTTRESKTKADAKSMTCSMSIYYKNTVYGSPAQLSGGEADRVSLAMTLALNSLLGSHLVLLDETLNTLDRNAKIQVVELLKTFVAENKICLVISHEGVEGVFDSVVKVGNQ
uniref:Rad50/SbcC-type AAA domain-containing protein n=1 Tax=viral metagenome TaxID=1070528 RepID=A0A6C0CGB4_9ZZZZ